MYTLIFAALFSFSGLDTHADTGAEIAPELATPEARQAEYNRLSSELEKLADRKAWSGAERAYDGLVATGIPVSFEAHILGAQTATQLGHVGEARERLLAAHELREERTVVEWLWTIDTTYSPVEIKAEPGADLTIQAVPFDPRAARAYESAKERLQQTGEFSGYLPKGAYTLQDEGFTLKGGEDVTKVTVDDAQDAGRRKRR